MSCFLSPSAEELLLKVIILALALVADVICDASGTAAELVVAVVARDHRGGRVLLAGDRDGRPDLAKVGRLPLRSGALGAVADRLEGLGQASGGLRLGC